MQIVKKGKIFKSRFVDMELKIRNMHIYIYTFNF